MKIFNQKGEEIGEFTPKAEEKSHSSGGAEDPGCVTAILFSVIFALYGFLDDTPSPTWYWIASWLGLSWCSYALLDPLTKWTHDSCLGKLVGLILALAVPVLLVFAHIILTGVLFT